MKKWFCVAAAVLVLGNTGIAFAQGPTLIGSFQVSDGEVWTNDPPTYSCLEACVEVFGGSVGEYSCSTSGTSVDNQAFVSGWGDSQYCTNPVAEDFKLNTSYNCGVGQCSYSAYVSDHCQDSTNYCYSSNRQPAKPVPVMSGPALLLLVLAVLLSGVVAFGMRSRLAGRS